MSIARKPWPHDPIDLSAMTNMLRAAYTAGELWSTPEGLEWQREGTSFFFTERDSNKVKKQAKQLWDALPKKAQRLWWLLTIKAGLWYAAEALEVFDEEFRQERNDHEETARPAYWPLLKEPVEEGEFSNLAEALEGALDEIEDHIIRLFYPPQTNQGSTDNAPQT